MVDARRSVNIDDRRYSSVGMSEEVSHVGSTSSATDSIKMARQLQRKWKAADKVAALQQRVRNYSNRHQCRPEHMHYVATDAEDTDNTKHVNTREMAILRKALKDTEGNGLTVPADFAMAELLKSGMRKYIDNALEEVDHVSRVNRAGAFQSFNWKTQGNAFDIPALRRSQAINNVSDDVSASDIDSLREPDIAPRPLEAFPVDFMHDFRGNAQRTKRQEKVAQTGNVSLPMLASMDRQEMLKHLGTNLSSIQDEESYALGPEPTTLSAWAVAGSRFSTV